MLSNLPPRELSEVKSLIKAAQEAPHMNGEMHRLQSKLNHLMKEEAAR